MKGLWVLGLGMVALAGTAKAQDVLYSGWGTHGIVENSWNMGFSQLAAPFTLSSASTINGARIPVVALICGNDPACGISKETINWALFTDDGNDLPRTELANGTVIPDFTLTLNGGSSYQEGYWTLDFAGVDISAPGQYWLSAQTTSGVVLWLTSLTPTPPGATFDSSTGTWAPIRATDDITSDYGNRLGVDILGDPLTAPEPSSLALLGTGLLGVVPAIRRRRRLV